MCVGQIQISKAVLILQENFKYDNIIIPSFIVGSSWLMKALNCMASAGLYGLVKKYIGLLLEDYATEADKEWYNFSRASKAVVTGRGQRLRVTSDFGRAYRSIIKYWRSWTMEEYLHFLETYSLYIFSADLMDTRMWTMWNLLR